MYLYSYVPHNLLVLNKRYKDKKKEDSVKINEAIIHPEVQVIDNDGNHLGRMEVKKAIELARNQGLDLIEISAKANPPVTQISDYGKHLYKLNKKAKEAKGRQKESSKTKVIQIKPGTGTNELELKGRKIGEWISKGHRVRIDLFLAGRYKYMENSFLREKLESFLPYISEPWDVSEQIKSGPKGMFTIVQKAKGGKSNNNQNDKDEQSNEKESEDNL